MIKDKVLGLVLLKGEGEEGARGGNREEIVREVGGCLGEGCDGN